MKNNGVIDSGHPGVVSGRIRLLRNIDNYVFPSKQTPRESAELIHRIEKELAGLSEVNGRSCRFRMLDDMSELERVSLREHHIFNSSVEEKKAPVGLILSEDEECGIVLGGTDHIRIQLTGAGLCLDALWEECDRIDDYIGARFTYAFDEKYGYLTSFPTNVGTGLRAAVVLHLPSLSKGRSFQSLTAEMARFGGRVRGVFGEGNENYGSFYEISNQNTLGVTEREIIDLVSRLALQILSQERQVRKLALTNRRVDCEDEAFRSYGVLKYARSLSLKDAMVCLSQLIQGLEDGIIKMDPSFPVYSLIPDIQPASLQRNSDRPLGKEELDAARADYIRSSLPELIEE